MVASLTFRLPDSAQPVRPALKVAKDVRYKDYILTVTFAGSNVEIQKEDVPSGLLWSTTLECPFVYLPDAHAPTTLFLAEFIPPSGARSITLSISPWATAAPDVDSVFSEMVLETTVVERPAVIIGEEE